MKTLSELSGAKPGYGQGVGKPKRGAGGTDNCVCPKCGAESAHVRGTPCNQIKCPKCGTPMQGK